MLNILRSIMDIVTTLMDFLRNSILSLMNFISQIPLYITFLTAPIRFLPNVLIPFALASITVYMVLFLIDRR